MVSNANNFRILEFERIRKMRFFEYANSNIDSNTLFEYSNMYGTLDSRKEGNMTGALVAMSDIEFP